MEKYNNFVETIERLQAAVSKMESASTTKEVEELELQTKDYFRALMMKFPYIQKDIHDYAMRQTERVIARDTRARLGK